MQNKQELRVKKAHIALMKHPETAQYSGVLLMGVSEVVEKASFTAYTDGVNKRYAKPFLETVETEPKLRGLVLHENLHVALKQIPRGKDMFKESARLANMSADFVVNDIIANIKGKVVGGNEPIVELPDGALYDPMFHNWSMREIYNYLKKNCKGQGKGKGKGQGQGQGQPQKGQGGGQGQGNQPGGEPCPDCDGTGNQGGKDSSGKPSYGPYGKNPKKDGEGLDTWSKEQIFQDMENGNGEYMDKHIGDDVPEEMRDAMVKDVMERLAARGLSAGNVETTLNKLRKKRKDYLKEIKRAVSNMIFGTVKQKTIVKPNRRQISGLKGNRKVKTKINCILDTSGSMGGTFEKVLSYVYRNDIEINLIEADTEVKWIENIKNKRKLETMVIKGLGGTILQPAIDLVADQFNEFNTVVLTDGYCDSLDLSKIKGRVLLISIGVKVPISRSNGKVKHIMVEKEN